MFQEFYFIQSEKRVKSEPFLTPLYYSTSLIHSYFKSIGYLDDSIPSFPVLFIMCCFLWPLQLNLLQHYIIHKKIVHNSECLITIFCFLFSFKVGWLVGWFFGHINLCRLFNTKFCLYVYTFNRRFLNDYLVGKFFYKQNFICLHMINQF